MMTRFKFTLRLVAVFGLTLCAAGAAYLSITGMVLLIPGDPTSALLLGFALETAKLFAIWFVVTTWFFHGWEDGIWFSLVCAIASAIGLTFITAVSLYAKLVLAHRYDPAVLLGLWLGEKEVIRWLIAVMVACFGTIAIILATVLGAERRRAAR
jgi:hypothetical protein